MKTTTLKMKTICRTAWLLLPMTLIAVGCASVATAAEHQLVAPGGGVKVIVSDAGGLNCRVEVDGKTVLTNSALGLEFQDGTKLGPKAVNAGTKTASHDGSWENHFGKRLKVRDHWQELRLTLQEAEPPPNYGVACNRSGNGGWLRRLVRHHGFCDFGFSITQSNGGAGGKLANILAKSEGIGLPVLA